MEKFGEIKELVKSSQMGHQPSPVVHANGTDPASPPTRRFEETVSIKTEVNHYGS